MTKAKVTSKQRTECQRCGGTGKNPSRAIRGRITTGATSSDTCPDCGGTGQLNPVKGSK